MYFMDGMITPPTEINGSIINAETVSSPSQLIISSTNSPAFKSDSTLVPSTIERYLFGGYTCTNPCALGYLTRRLACAVALNAPKVEPWYALYLEMILYFSGFPV